MLKMKNKIDIERLDAALHKTADTSELTLLGQRVGAKLLTVVLETLGGPYGMQVYIPTPQNYLTAIERPMRDDEIYRSHNGRNTAAIARKYKITPARVRQICAAQRERLKRHGKRPTTAR